MKIAIPSDEGTYLSQHFGRTLGFTIFEVENGQIVNQEYRPNTFTGHALGRHHEHHHHGGAHDDHHHGGAHDNHHHGGAHDDHHHGNHGGILKALSDCEVVIAGGMGRRLFDDLTEAGKKIYVTSQLETRKAAEMFLADTLKSDKGTCHHT